MPRRAARASDGEGVTSVADIRGIWTGPPLTGRAFCEMGAGLAGDEHAYAGRQVDIGELVDEQSGWFHLPAGTPAHDSVDVVETVDDEEYVLLGIRAAARLQRGDESFGRGCEPRPQFNGRFGHDQFELAQKTPDGYLGEDSFFAVDVGRAQPAVVPSNNPVGPLVGVRKLFAEPGFPHTGFTGDDDTAALGCDGVDVCPYFSSSPLTRHGDGSFNGVSIGDGAEIRGESDLGRKAFSRRHFHR